MKMNTNAIYGSRASLTVRFPDVQSRKGTESGLVFPSKKFTNSSVDLHIYSMSISHYIDLESFGKPFFEGVGIFLAESYQCPTSKCLGRVGICVFAAISPIFVEYMTLRAVQCNISTQIYVQCHTGHYVFPKESAKRFTFFYVFEGEGGVGKRG